MRIEALRGFLAVVEMKSFSRAAESLFITQSALSRQISELEREAGVALLRRTTRNVQTTDAGRTFYHRARNILGEWEMLGREMREYSGRRVERLCIGYTTSEQLPFILEGTRRGLWQRTGRDVTIRRVHPGEILTELRAGLLSCAFMHRPTLQGARDLEAAVLVRPGMVAMVPLDSPLAGRGSVSLRDLKGYTDVRCVHERDPYYYDAIDAGFSEKGYPAPAHIETGESEEVALLAKQMDRMSLCPAIYPHPEGFAAVLIADFKRNFDFLMVRSPDAPPELLDDLEKEMKEYFAKWAADSCKNGINQMENSAIL